MAEYYNRETLFNEIWEKPTTEVCKKYNLSDVGLTKVCRKLNIPKPPVGYWTKKAYNKAPEKPDLPDFDNAPKIPIIKASIKKEKPLLVPEAFEQADNIIKTITEVSIPDDVENFHPYIRNTRKVFKRKIKKREQTLYNRFSVDGSDVFDINIGENSIERVSLILQALCNVIIKNGFKVVLEEKKGAVFQITNKNILIKISETTNKVKVSEEDKKPHKYYHYDYEYTPSGILKLEIDTQSFSMKERTSWADTKTINLEDRLLEITHSLIRAAAWIKEYDAFKKKREEERAIEEKRRREREKLARIEKERISHLEKGFNKWFYHNQMSEYINAVKTHYIKNQGNPEGDFKDWIDWAENYLSEINPLNGEYPKYDIITDNSWLNYYFK